MGIRERYTIAATREHKQGVEINLSDGELRQILISLMNARAVVYFGDGQYGPAVEVGQWTPQSELVWLCGGMNPGAQPQVGPATACSDSSGGFRQQLARHVALGLVVLAREHAPVPLDTFQSKLLNEGGDKDFLQQNEQIVLDQMVYLKQVKMTADGLIMSSVRGPPVPASPTAEAPSPFPGKRPSGLTKRNQ
jgi:hypothetical protein